MVTPEYYEECEKVMDPTAAMEVRRAKQLSLQLGNTNKVSVKSTYKWHYRNRKSLRKTRIIRPIYLSKANQVVCLCFRPWSSCRPVWMTCSCRHSRLRPSITPPGSGISAPNAPSTTLTSFQVSSGHCRLVTRYRMILVGLIGYKI